MDLTNTETRISEQDKKHIEAILTQFGKKLNGLKDNLYNIQLTFHNKVADLERFNSLANELYANSKYVLIVASENTYRSIRCLVNSLPTRHNILLCKESFGLNTLINRLYHIYDFPFSVIVVCSELPVSPWVTNSLKLLTRLLLHRYGQAEADKRLVLIADPDLSPKDISIGSGNRIVRLPPDIPPNYHTLTPAGLIPAAIAGIDLEQLTEGAKSMLRFLTTAPFSDNIYLKYLMYRHRLLYAHHYDELVLIDDDTKSYLGEWIKHLYQENSPPELNRPFNLITSPGALSHLITYHKPNPKRLDTYLLFHADTPTLPPSCDHKCQGNPKENVWNELTSPLLAYHSDTIERARSLLHSKHNATTLITIPKADAFHLGALIALFESANTLSLYIHGLHPKRASSLPAR